MAATTASTNNISKSNDTIKSGAEKPMQVRLGNITAARAVADAIRTSLGPRGLDKMIETGRKEIIISNDGATIMKHLSVLHPAAHMLVDLSMSQDSEAGDGTTSVVVFAGSLLAACEKLLNKGIHPAKIVAGFKNAAKAAVDVLEGISIPIVLSDRESLLKSATTSLGSKIVSQHSSTLAPIAVDSVLRVVDPSDEQSVNLSDIRIVKKIGGTIEDTMLVPGLVLNQNVITSANGPRRIEKAKIGLIQFQLSPPKPDMDNQIVVNDYRQMDQILKEERTYLLNIVKQIKKAGCNVLLIQKSILRDAVNTLSLHFLSKLKIMAIKEIERDEIEFLCKTLGCKPIADIESFTEDKLGYADLIEETEINDAKFVQISGIKNQGRTASIVCFGSNQLVLEETERSLHDAQCVIRCLVKKKSMVAGGGAPEIEISQKLFKMAKMQIGYESLCFSAFAEAVEVIPITLAENAGLNPISVITELRSKHADGEKYAGINVKKGMITNIIDENVLQPLLVSTSLIELATETIERDEIEFLCKTLGCKPIADIESFTEDKLGYADLIEETEINDAKFVQISGIKNQGRTASIVCFGSNQLVLEETERSLHDAQCVIRCLVKKKSMVAGGGAPEIEISQKLFKMAKMQIGYESLCFSAFAEAVEVIPITLAENAGLNPISVITELRSKHADGEKYAGINVKKGMITNIIDENVLQPLLVSTSLIELATETFNNKWNKKTFFKAKKIKTFKIYMGYYSILKRNDIPSKFKVMVIKAIIHAVSTCGGELLGMSATRYKPLQQVVDAATRTLAKCGKSAALVRLRKELSLTDQI
ncbi:hypothetical protein BB561_005103 [Smittium simulii]|uniref:T-complex protein 1 subunit delta n=1 Tax=Smittium simulii TaxID=133385 RepID=A0A2T9YC74_9FUNG|nr:hypothetical protein BB561_005103 [Smittium simulii]